MNQWNIVGNNNKVDSVEAIIDTILIKRGLVTKKDREKFLNPNITDITLKSCGLDEKEVANFKKRIGDAIRNKEQIVIFGDYDVDGICSSAILWETLYAKTKKVIPYIPDRVDEGYGLSIKGVDNVLEAHPDTKIIITVDNGIVAFDAVEYATKKGLDVIVTDHHVKGEKSPGAFCILHTTKLCGAGIAWVLSRELGFETKKRIDEKLELAALATVADLVPLLNENRIIVKYGLEQLKKTQRVGVNELLTEAGVDKKTLGVYAVGHVIAPRLNATGRIQSAMNALRLICTKNPEQAKMLSSMLGDVNRTRQGLTLESLEHAKLLAIENSQNSRITIVADESYNQGIIGLVASQLVENYYKPAIAISKGDKISKGSARSISGVNIIELIRSVSHTIIEAGGHPMAAGFSVETVRIEEFINAISEKAQDVVTDELLKRKIKIDALIPFNLITSDLVLELSKLEPFGMGNPEPVFVTNGVEILESRKIGREQAHLKMKLQEHGKVIDAIGFGKADLFDISSGDSIDVAYTIDENEWNGKKSLQLKIRDIKN